MSFPHVGLKLIPSFVHKSSFSRSLPCSLALNSIFLRGYLEAVAFSDRRHKYRMLEILLSGDLASLYYTYIDS